MAIIHSLFAIMCVIGGHFGNFVPKNRAYSCVSVDILTKNMQVCHNNQVFMCFFGRVMVNIRFRRRPFCFLDFMENAQGCQGGIRWI